MKRNLWEARIPTTLALAVLLLGIGITSLLIQRGIITVGRASPDKIPQNIQITNTTDTSFTLVFTTNLMTQAFVNIITNEAATTTIFDDRDALNGVPNSYFSHHITFKNLKPNTSYSYMIIVDGDEILDNNKPFTASTTMSLKPTQSLTQDIKGTALTPDASSANDTLVVLNTQDGKKISTITNSNGEYVLKNIYSIAEGSPITLQFLRQSLTSQVKSLYSTTKDIPLVTLSKNYDFTSDTPTIVNNQDQTSALDTVPISGTTSTTEVKITNPTSNASTIDQKPQFKGTAPPGTKVKITIESTPQQTEVTTDKNGTWSFRVNEPLAPGLHTITIEAKDASGILRKLTQKFTVFAEGSQVSQSATPSATLTVSPTPTKTQSPTTTIVPSNTLQPTPTFVKITPTPTTVSPTPVLKPGNIETTFIPFAISFGFIIIGSLLLFTL